MGRLLPFPQVCALGPVRGRRISRVQSKADLVFARISKWSEGGRDELWSAVVSRSQAPACSASPTPDLEKSVIAALRLSDVRKALQLFVSAPIAPKCDATFQALKALHPQSAGSPVSELAGVLHDAPVFGDDRVGGP